MKDLDHPTTTANRSATLSVSVPPNERTPLVAPLSVTKPKQRRPLVLWLVAALAILVFGLGVATSSTKKLFPCALRMRHENKGSHSLYFQSGRIGDTSRPDFASRRDANLILFDDFSSMQSLEQLWQPDVSLFGEGNAGFAYYTDSSDNVNVERGNLLLRPGLFANLGPLQTVTNKVYDAADVMAGNCFPFPECSTFNLGEECTIADFAGCQRIGTPLVLLNPATSGRVSTRNTFHFTYGRLEARIRLPRGDWLWPAFWLMPLSDDFGPWPNSGEIDLMEGKGNAPGYVVGDRENGRDVFVSSLHYAGNPWWHTQATAKASELLACGDQTKCDFSDEFFTVGFYWTDRRMYSYVLLNDNKEHILWDANAAAGFGPDDVPLGSRAPPFGRTRDQYERTPVSGAGPYVNTTFTVDKNAPFDRPFYIIFNLAVGGVQNGCPDPNYWGEHAIWCTQRDASRPEVAASTVFWEARDKWLPTWEGARAAEREAFTIDWVKVWQ